MNGSPLFDVSVDVDPRDNRRYIGVVKLPQGAGVIPNLDNMDREVEVDQQRFYQHWVS